MQKNLKLRLSEKEIALMIETLKAEHDKAARNNNISRCCDIWRVVEKIESAEKFA